MKNRNYDDDERRKRNAHLRLGTQTPYCCMCGENDWRCLEAHHIAGEAQDGITCIVCRNCHRKLSDMQRDHPAVVSFDHNELEASSRFLFGLSDLFRVLEYKMKHLGMDLLERARKDEEVQ